MTEARKYLNEFIKGVPELGIPSLTPFVLPQVLAIDTGADGIKFKLNSATVDTAQGLKINSLKYVYILLYFYIISCVYFKFRSKKWITLLNFHIYR